MTFNSSSGEGLLAVVLVIPCDSVAPLAIGLFSTETATLFLSWLEVSINCNSFALPEANGFDFVSVEVAAFVFSLSGAAVVNFG